MAGRGEDEPLVIDVPRPTDAGPRSRTDRRRPTTLRQHATGADSARRVLLTVLGEFLLPSEGWAWTSAFIEVLGRLRIEEGTARQALSRTAAAGWLQSQRAGRRTCWRLTPSGTQLLEEGTERIYGFRGPITDWDGRWLLVLASVPETDRAARHQLRTRLTWAGLGSPAPGVWVGTQPSRRVEVEEVLDRAGVLDGAQVFVATHEGTTRLGAMVDQAWDLAAIAEEYDRFIAEFSPPGAADPLTRVVELVHSWRRFPWRDPALPVELLPAGWKGGDAVRLFRRRHAEWTVAATREWGAVSLGT